MGGVGHNQLQQLGGQVDHRSLSPWRTDKARPSSEPGDRPQLRLGKASAELLPTVGSPVERISGPSSGSTPGNLANGRTTSFTE